MDNKYAHKQTLSACRDIDEHVSCQVTDVMSNSVEAVAARKPQEWHD